MLGSVLRSQNALDLQGLHLYAGLDTFWRDRDTADAGAPNNCQQG